MVPELWVRERYWDDTRRECNWMPGSLEFLQNFFNRWRDFSDASNQPRRA